MKTRTARPPFALFPSLARGRRMLQDVWAAAQARGQSHKRPLHYRSRNLWVRRSARIPIGTARTRNTTMETTISTSRASW